MKKNTRKVFNVLNPKGELVETILETTDILGPESLIFDDKNFHPSMENNSLSYVVSIANAKTNIYRYLGFIINKSDEHKDHMNEYSKKKAKSYFKKMKSMEETLLKFPDDHFIVALLTEDVADLKTAETEQQKIDIINDSARYAYYLYHREVLLRIFNGYYNGWNFSPADWAKTKKFKSFASENLKGLGDIKVLPNDRLFELCGETYYKFSIHLNVLEEVLEYEFDNETFQKVFYFFKQHDISAVKEKDKGKKDGLTIELITKFDNSKVK